MNCFFLKSPPSHHFTMMESPIPSESQKDGHQVQSCTFKITSSISNTMGFSLGWRIPPTGFHLPNNTLLLFHQDLPFLWVMSSLLLTTIISFLSFLFFLFFSPRPVVFGSSQARGQITATAGARRDPDHDCDPHHSSRQCQIPLSEARDRICILMDTSQICFHWTTRGTPSNYYF